MSNGVFDLGFATRKPLDPDYKNSLQEGCNSNTNLINQIKSARSRHNTCFIHARLGAFQGPYCV
jgi:hypothetical protein